jgi:hypothetical protein
MKFQVTRSSLGAVSRQPPCNGAVRGEEAVAWPGEYVWFVELNSLEELQAFLEANGGGLGLFVPEEGEEYPVIEIFDDDEDEE